MKTFQDYLESVQSTNVFKAIKKGSPDYDIIEKEVIDRLALAGDGAFKVLEIKRTKDRDDNTQYKIVVKGLDKKFYYYNTEKFVNLKKNSSGKFIKMSFNSTDYSDKKLPGRNWSKIIKGAFGKDLGTDPD